MPASAGSTPKNASPAKRKTESGQANANGDGSPKKLRTPKKNQVKKSTHDEEAIAKGVPVTKTKPSDFA